MKKYEFIFCDLDGPILEGKERHYTCYCDIVSEYGGTPIAIEEYWDMKRSMVKRTVLLEKTGFLGTYDDYIDRWLQKIEDPYYLHKDYLKPNIKEALRHLKLLTSHLCLVTMRNHTEALLDQLRWFRIESLFEHVYVGKSSARETKFDLVKDVEFDSALVIGDTEADTELAEKLGVPMIGITNGLRKRELLKADAYIEDLQDLIYKNINI